VIDFIGIFGKNSIVFAGGYFALLVILKILVETFISGIEILGL
jgi:hypothetical protein